MGWLSNAVLQHLTMEAVYQYQNKLSIKNLFDRGFYHVIMMLEVYLNYTVEGNNGNNKKIKR